MLGLLLPDRPEVDAALGDLHEVWLRRRRRTGRFAAALWYLREGASLMAYRLPGRRGVEGGGWPGRSSAGTGFGSELAVSARTFLRRPLLPLTSLLTLGPALAAVGLGLALVWAIFLRPLPYPDADRLVVVEHSWDGIGTTGISTPLYEFYGEQARSADRLGLVSWTTSNLGRAGAEARHLPAVRVTSTALELLGARPALGRLPGAEEDGAGGAPVVVLTHELWSDAFGSDPAVIGATVIVDGVSRTIAGVTAPGLEFPGFTRANAASPRLILPAEIDRSGQQHILNIEWWYALARLSPGAGAGALQAELGTLLRRAVTERSVGNVTQTYLDENGIAPVVTELLPWQTGDVADFVELLVAAVLLLLLLAVAALTNVFLSRGEARAGELQVRRALGAGHARIFGHLLAESVVLCVGPAVLGGAGAWLAVDQLLASSSLALPRTETGALGPAAATIAVTLAVALVPVFALLPFRYARVSMRQVAARRTTLATGMRKVMLGGQLAVCTVLLVAALALGSSVRALAERPLGFRTENVLTFKVSLPEPAYPDTGRTFAFHAAVLEGLRGLTGVVSASYADGLPTPDAQWSGASIVVEGEPESAMPPVLALGHVESGFHEALGIATLAGRPLEPRDSEAGRRVVLVNEAFADRYWGSAQAALGRRIRPSRETDWLEIVGVVGNTAGDGVWSAVSPDPVPIVYAPAALSPWAMRYVIYTVRTAGPPLALAPAVRTVVAGVDRTVPVFDVASVEDRVVAASARERLALRGTGISGAASVVVVATSLIGLVLLTLLQRRREIGVRKAVGATNAGLRWLLLRGALVPAAIGLLAGAAAVLGGLRVPASLLHGGTGAVAPLLPVAGALLLLVLAAGVLASRRVARVEPTEALRAE